ncbi:hypothetical protein BaRGS_00013667 [Batillaria attramentaria]|uniref:Uncharacterized protein n=1 Tax=Batillaria attramentaria TaxID=370345 RepID=A0ABD0L779_9CAEN
MTPKNAAHTVTPLSAFDVPRPPQNRTRRDRYSVQGNDTETLTSHSQLRPRDTQGMSGTHVPLSGVRCARSDTGRPMMLSDRES